MSNPRNINQVLQGASASQPAQLPGIPAVQVADRALADVLRAIKERLEVREGTRGNPFEAAVTWRQLDELGLIRTTPAPARVTDMAGIIAQTKNGEFVQVSVQDLAAAVTPTTTAIAPTADASVLVNALKVQLTAQLAALGIRIDSLDNGAGSVANINEIIAYAAAKIKEYDAAILVATAKIKEYDAALVVASAKIAEYDAAIAVASAKIAEYDAIIISGTNTINAIINGTLAITLSPNAIMFKGGTYAGATYVNRDYTTTDLMLFLLDVNARLAAHGI